MANNVEERIVQMKFDNVQFEQGIKTSMSSLESFDKSLRSKEGTRGLSEIAGGIQKITSVSTGLIAKMTVISNLTNSLFNSAKNLVKSVTLEPITTGMSEYETKMGSVQTILSGTGESLEVVMGKLEELNKYADRTIYSFQDMTSNIGKFTNAGVKLDVATKAIQGVSNLAAVSGAGAAEASRAMYNISQALGTGYMQLMDWKSIENANMATMEFKQTLIETAKEMGVLNETSTVTAENFRETLNDKWLTNDVLLTTLQKYTDETTELGKKAFAAATEIKTASQLFDVMKESVQSGWAQTWENVIGNFEEAKQLFTGIGQVFDFFAGRSADARNSVLKDWKELGGRTDLIQSLYNAFANVLMILKPFRDAFREVFPSITGKNLADFTKKLREFTGQIWISRDAADGLKNIIKMLLTPIKMAGKALQFAGEGAKILATLVWLLAQKFLSLFKSTDGISNSLNKIFGNEKIVRIGEAFVSIVKELGKGFTALGSAALSLFRSINGSGLIGSIGSFALGGFDRMLEFVASGLEKISNLLRRMPTPKFDWKGLISAVGSGLQILVGLVTSFTGKIHELYTASGGVFGILSKIGTGISSIFAPMKVLAKETDNTVATLDEGFVIIEEETVAMASSVEEATGKLDNMTTTAGNIKSSLSGLSNIMSNFKNVLSKLPLKSVGNGFKNFFNSLSEAIKNISPAKVLIIGFGVSLIFLVKSITKFTTSLSKMLDSFGGIGHNMSNMLASIGGAFNSLKGVFTQFQKTIKGVGKSISFEHYTAGIKNLAVAIGILAGAVLAFAIAIKYLELDWTQIAIGAGTIAAITLAIGALAIAMSKLDANAKLLINLASIAGFVLVMSISITLLAKAFNELNYSLADSAVAEGKIAIMLSLLAGLSVACIAISKFAPQLSKGAFTMISVAAAMNLMVKAFERFAEIPQITFQNTIAISGMMVAAAIAFSGLSKFSIKAAVGIGLFTAALMLVPLAVNAIQSIVVTDVNGLISNFMMIMSGLATFMLASMMAGDNIAKAGVGILAAVSSLIVVGKAIQMLAGISKEDVTKAAPVIAGILVVYGLITALSYFSGKNAIRAGIMVQLMSVALIAIVGAVSIMTLIYDEFDKKAVDSAVLAVGGLMLVFGGLVALSKFAGSVTGITSIIAGVGLLLVATALLTLLDPKELQNSTLAISGIMIAFAIALKASENANWKGALTMTAAIIAVAGSLIVVSKVLAGVDWKVIAASAVGMSVMANGFALATKTLSKISVGKDTIGQLLAFAGVAGVMSGLAWLLGEVGQKFFAIDWQGLLFGATSLGIMANAFASSALILSKADFGDMTAVGQNMMAFVGIAATMAGVAGLLGKFAGEFMALPIDDLIFGAVSLGIMANAFAAATIVLSKADFGSFDKMFPSLVGFAGIAGAMAIAVNLLAPAFVKMAGIPWDTLMSCGAAVATMAVGMSAATGIISIFAGTMEKHVKGMLIGAGMLIAMGVACRILAPALVELSQVEFSGMLAGLIGLAGAVLILGGAAVILGSIGTQVLLGAGALAALGVALLVLMPSLERLSKIPFMKTLGGIGALTVAIIALGGTGFLLGALAPQMLLGAVSLAAFGAALLVIMPSLERLADIPFMDALGGIGALTVAIVALGATGFVLGTLAPQMLLGALSIAAFGAALFVFLPALERLSNIPLMDTLGGIGALTIAIVALGATGFVLGTLAPQMLLGALSIAAFGAALFVFLPALERISQLSFPSLIQGLAGMGIAIVGLGVCAGILGALFPVMASGTAILIGLGAAANIIALALNLAATGVSKFAMGFNQLMSVLAMIQTIDLMGIAAGLGAIGLACGVLALVGLALPIVSVGIVLLAGALGLLSASIMLLNTVLASAEAINNIFQSGANLIASLVEGFMSGITDLYNAAKDAIQGFLNGINEFVSDLWTAGAEAASAFLGGFRSKDGLDSHSPARATSKAAEDAAAGWLQGIEKTKKDYENSGKETASTYIDGQTTIIDEEVPKAADLAADKYVEGVKANSDTYQEAGEAIVAEQVAGIEANSGELKEAGKQNGLETIIGMIDGFKEKHPELADKIDGIKNMITDKLGGVLSGISADGSILELFSREGLNFDSIFGGGEEGAEGMSGMLDGLAGGFDSVGSSAGGAKSSIDEVTDSLEEMKDNIASGIDLFSKFDTTVDTSISEMLVNLQSQLEGTSKWSQDLANLTAMGFEEAFVKTLADQGTSSYKYVEALQSATKEQIFVYNLMYKESTQTADKAIEFVKQALPTLTAKVAEETGKTVELVGHTVKEAEDGSKQIVDSTGEVIDIVEDTVAPVEELTDATVEEKEAMVELTDEMNNTQESMSNLEETVKNEEEALGELSETTTAVQEGMIELEETVVSEGEALEELSEVTSDTQEGMESMAESANETAKSTEDFGESIQLTTEQAIEFVKGMAKIDAELETMKKSLKETITSQMDIFEKFDNETKISKEELLANMQSQIDGIAAWASNMSELVERGIDEGLLGHLRELGPEGSEYVDAFISMTDSELARAGELFQTSLNMPDSAANQIAESMKTTGRYSVQGLLDGILERTEEVKQAGINTAMAYNQGYIETEQIHSPSVVQFNNGRNDVQGLINGIKSMIPSAANTGKLLANGVSTAIKGILNYSTFYQIGLDIDRGLAAGIIAMAQQVADEAVAMAAKIRDSVKAELGVHSPSTEFYEIGKFTDLGFANGIRDYGYAVEESSKNLGDTAIESMRDTINKLNAYAMSDIDDMVIRPVLDLSEIQNGSKKVNDLLSNGIYATSVRATQAYHTTAAIAERNTPQTDNTSSGNAGNTYNFTQNNYSPKALSRIDIYRQTNNQFSQLKGLVEGT